MPNKPEIGVAVGPSDATRWGQAIMLPHAYGVVEICDPAGHARERGVAVLTKLTDTLLVAPEDSASLEAVAEHFDETVVTLILIVPHRRACFMIVRGHGCILLKRDHQYATLLSGEGSISGAINPGDIILALSGRFSEVVSPEEVVTFFDHMTATAIAEKLTVRLHEAKESTGSVGMVMCINTPSNEVSEESPELLTPVVSMPRRRFSLDPFVTWSGNFIRRARSPGAPMRAIRKLRHPRAIVHAIRTESNIAMKIVTVILIGLFCVSVALGIWKQVMDTKTQNIRTALASAHAAFDEGSSLLSLNPGKARDKLREAQGLLARVKQDVAERSVLGREFAQLDTQVADMLTQALQIVQTEPTFFYDVSLIKKGGTASQLTVDGEYMVILDKATHTIYRVSMRAKSGEILVGGADYVDASAVSVHGDSAYILTENGVHAYSVAGKKTRPLIIKRDPAWGVIGSLVSYGGNVYLLDMQKSRIWKYINTGGEESIGTFSTIQEYLNADTFADFSQGTGMSIDGSVWVGTSSGDILRFAQGRSSPFVPRGVDPALGSRLVIYTDDVTKFVYVLASDQKRVVVLDKEGNYVAQYVWKGDMSPTQIAVSEEQKKILLLSSGKIYSVDLK